jgi:hypothetical protein
LASALRVYDATSAVRFERRFDAECEAYEDRETE